MTAPAWRPMRAGDLPDVERISAIVHPRYPEREEVPVERLRLFPDGCLIAARGDATIGYAIAHPGVLGRPPALDTLLGALPDDADCLYIHDVALLPEVRGLRFGEALTAILAEVAQRHGFARLALTAVNNSTAFWSRQGFTTAPIKKSLASYGDDAAYMVRML
jgi:ribosomal protein S18 acetylase RimI-like enzyme